MIHALGSEAADRLDPANRAVDLAGQRVAELPRPSAGARVGVRDHGNPRVQHGHFLEQRLHPRAGRGHQRAMKGGRDGQRDRAFGAARRARFTRAADRRGVAGDDRLLGGIEVGGRHDLAARGLFAGGLDLLRGKPDDRRHGTHTGRNRLLHEAPALPDEPQGVGECQRSGGHVGGILADRMPRRECGLREPLRRAGLELPQRSDRVGQDRRLRIDRRAELFLRTLETKRRQRESEDRVGFRENAPRGLRSLAERLAHPDELRALPGEEKGERHTEPAA